LPATVRTDIRERRNPPIRPEKGTRADVPGVRAPTRINHQMLTNETLADKRQVRETARGRESRQL
jgi:hypothetical protein